MYGLSHISGPDIDDSRAKFGLGECLRQIFEARHDFIGHTLKPVDHSVNDVLYEASVKKYLGPMGQGALVHYCQTRNIKMEDAKKEKTYISTEFQQMNITNLRDGLWNLYLHFHPGASFKSNEVIKFFVELYTQGCDLATKERNERTIRDKAIQDIPQEYQSPANVMAATCAAAFKFLHENDSRIGPLTIIFPPSQNLQSQ